MLIKLVCVYVCVCVAVKGISIQTNKPLGYFFGFSLFCVRVRVGFEPRKLQNKQRKITINNLFLWNFLLIVMCDCQGLIMLSINLVSTFYFTLWWVCLLLIWLTSTQHAETVLFFKACWFLPLAGGFTILNWRKTEKKQEMALCNYFWEMKTWLWGKHWPRTTRDSLSCVMY
jgi:hypothetical protein